MMISEGFNLQGPAPQAYSLAAMRTCAAAFIAKPKLQSGFSKLIAISHQLATVNYGIIRSVI